jgi:hypothetical protein
VQIELSHAVLKSRRGIVNRTLSWGMQHDEIRRLVLPVRTGNDSPSEIKGGYTTAQPSAENFCHQHQLLRLNKGATLQLLACCHGLPRAYSTGNWHCTAPGHNYAKRDEAATGNSSQ